jgi:hypothetical protein
MISSHYVKVGKQGLMGYWIATKEEDFFWKATKVIDSACINAF